MRMIYSAAVMETWRVNRQTPAAGSPLAASGTTAFSLLCCARKIARTTMPATGTRTKSCNQPLRPVSRNLRVPAASKGRSVARKNTAPRERAGSEVGVATDAATPARVRKRANHQYSDLDAVPLKSEYLVKQTRIDSRNVMRRSPLECLSWSKSLPGLLSRLPYAVDSTRSVNFTPLPLSTSTPRQGRGEALGWEAKENQSGL